MVRAPDGFAVTAASERAAVAAFEDPDRRLAGVQYHPEVGHSPHGQQVLERFLHEIAGIPGSWTTASIIDETVEAVRAQSATGGRSAASPAASTPRWRPRSSSEPSATGSPACSSTTGSWGG